MRLQLIKFGPAGTVSGLDFKRRGVNLRALGHAKVERTTEIEWNESHQAWTIKILRLGGTYSGVVLTESTPRLPDAVKKLAKAAPGGLLVFLEYEDAVAAEIHFVQSVRRRLAI